MNQLEKTLLFAKPLAFTSTASLDECMKCFQALEVRPKSLFQTSAKTVALAQISETRCSVDIRTKYKGYTYVHVIGMIEGHEDGTMLFDGYIKLGIMSLISGLCALLPILVLASFPRPVGWPLIICIVVFFYFIFTISTDRNRLIQAVQTAMATGHDIDH